MNTLKASVKRLLLSAGLELTRIDDKPEPPPVCETFDEACKRRNYGEVVSFLCPLEKIVTVNGFSFGGRNCWHPFVEAMQEYISSGYRQTYSGSSLERFYQKWQPKNSLEALIGASGPAVLRDYPAYAMHSPWLDIDPHERKVYMQRMIHDENQWSGVKGVDASEGYGLHGPVTPQKGKIEYDRLVRTLQSVRVRGYDRRVSGEDVTVVALEGEDDCRFCIAHGQHRVPILAALGYDSVPVSITKVARISEIPNWPQVYRGHWRESEAADYIDHLFNFDAHRWALNRDLTRCKHQRGLPATAAAPPMEVP